jgi:hypothetical protein
VDLSTNLVVGIGPLVCGVHSIRELIDTEGRIPRNSGRANT